MNNLPAWLRYDKLVLRFGAFVKEPTHNPAAKFNPVTRQLETSSAESFKVRRFQIQYFMGDKGAIQIVEDGSASGGQRKGPGNGGTFLRKTNDLKRADGNPFAATDFFVGAQVEINKRTFHVVSVDKATRNFFTGEHPDHHVGRNLDWPADPEAARASKDGGGVACVGGSADPHRARFAAAEAERTAGGAKGNKKKKKGAKAAVHRPAVTQSRFLDNDGKLLKFRCVWDERANPGTGRQAKRPRRFMVKFYLADDTLEVNEVNDRNSGRSRMETVNLKRQQLPNPAAPTGAALAAARKALAADPTSAFGDPAFYNEGDLVVGRTLECFGRRLRIVGCGAFTREYYRDYLSMPQPANDAAGGDWGGAGGDKENGGHGAGSPAARANRLRREELKRLLAAERTAKTNRRRRERIAKMAEELRDLQEAEAERKKKAKNDKSGLPPQRHSLRLYSNPDQKIAQLLDAIRDKLEIKARFQGEYECRRLLRTFLSRFGTKGQEGHLTKPSFRKAMSSFSCFGTDADRMYDMYDANGDGKLDYAEFVDVVFPPKGGGAGAGGGAAAGGETKEEEKEREEKARARSARLRADPRVIQLELSIRRKIESMSGFGMEAEQKRTLQKVFRRFDTDRSGHVSRKEFKGALGQLNCWDKDANLLFDAYDVTGDGQLSYDEFSAVLHVKEALQ